MIDSLILQRVIPTYRVNVFRNLQSINPRILMVIGEDVPNSKVKNAKDLRGINLKKMKTVHFNILGRTLTWHIGLFFFFLRTKPKRIVCEAESHVIGYVTAVFYKLLFDRKVKLGYWCFIRIPGKEYDSKSLAERFKKYMRGFFDHFFLYHNYGKMGLIELGYEPEKISVVTNVGRVEKFKSLSESKIPKQTARELLNLPDDITLLFLGALDPNKDPMKLIDIQRFADFGVNLIFLGGGPRLKEIQSLAETTNSILAPGHIAEGLSDYLSAVDLLVVPSRGGVIISELLGFGIPVLVHQADGVERDIIQNGVNGYLLPDNNTSTFVSYITRAKKELIGSTIPEIQFDSMSMAKAVCDGLKRMSVEND